MLTYHHAGMSPGGPFCHANLRTCCHAVLADTLTCCHADVLRCCQVVVLNSLCRCGLVIKDEVRHEVLPSQLWLKGKECGGIPQCATLVCASHFGGFAATSPISRSLRGTYLLLLIACGLSAANFATSGTLRYVEGELERHPWQALSPPTSRKGLIAVKQEEKEESGHTESRKAKSEDSAFDSEERSLCTTAPKRPKGLPVAEELKEHPCQRK